MLCHIDYTPPMLIIVWFCWIQKFFSYENTTFYFKNYDIIKETSKHIMKYLTVKQISICQTLYHYIAQFKKVGEYTVYRFDIDIVHACQVSKF